MRRRLAFIDHSFHRKSLATAGLKAVLRRQYDVSEFWDESWSGAAPPDARKIAEQDYDILVFFQTLFAPSVLKTIGCRHVVWVPMFDDVIATRTLTWARCQNIRIICFSRTLYEFLRRNEFECRYFQYFVDPDVVPARVAMPSQEVRAFFWQRTSRIDLPMVLRLLEKTPLAMLHVHDAPDPGSPRAAVDLVTAKHAARMSVTRWFPNRETYLRTMSLANVFVAPRILEGIGMSFLEAMAMGLCVVGADRPTMNEYIRHEQNGILFQPEAPAAVDLSRLERLCGAARETASLGFRRWKGQQDELLEYVGEPPKHGRSIFKTLRLLVSSPRYPFGSYAG